MSGEAREQALANRSGHVAGNRLDVTRSPGVRTAIIAEAMIATVIAGCASPGLPESATPPAVPSPQVVTASPPAALSPTAYQETLRDATSAMAPAFDRLNSAGSPEDFRAALEQASTAASDAAQQLDVIPPAEVQATHRDLIVGLHQLTTDLSQLKDQVASMELCAAPSILASVSNTPGVSTLRTVREALGSSQLGTSYQWGEFLPAPTPLPDRQLANGQLVDSLQRNGRGKITIDNGADSDAVVKLAQGGRSIVSVYVSKRSSATAGQINDGSYEIFYTSGADWDNQLKAFTRSCQFERFDKTAEFATTSVSNGIEYTEETVGLQPSINGNARTESVPAKSFPR